MSLPHNENFICAFCTLTKMHITNKMPQCTKENDDTQVNIFFFFQDNFFTERQKTKRGKEGTKTHKEIVLNFSTKISLDIFILVFFFFIPYLKYVYLDVYDLDNIYSFYTHNTYLPHNFLHRYYNYTTQRIHSFSVYV